MYLNLNKACKKIVHIFRLAKGKGDARRRKKVDRDNTILTTKMAMEA